MRPSGKRTTHVTLYLSPCEALVADLARLLDGTDGVPTARATWVLARAVERLGRHAEEGSTRAAAALVALGLERRLVGAAEEGKKPPRCSPPVATALAGLRDLAERLGDEEAQREAAEALARLQSAESQDSMDLLPGGSDLDAEDDQSAEG